MPAVVWVILSLLFAGGAGALLARYHQVGNQSASVRVVAWAQAAESGPQAEQAVSQRERLRLRLEALAQSVSPTDRSPPGWLQYVPLPPVSSIDYVCPKCGRLTTHAGATAELIARDLAQCREAVQAIHGLAVSLDESPLCGLCWSYGSCDSDYGSLVLDIAFEGETEHQRAEGVTSDDLRALAEFVDAKPMHRGPYNAQTPLRDYVPRLAQILGVPLPRAASARQADLRARLAALAKAVAPPPRYFLAMCYASAGPPGHADYVCPKCGQRTIYAGGNVWLVESDLPAMRRMVLMLPGLSAELDESQFCRRCHPESTKPTLALDIYFRGATEPSRVENITEDDLSLLAEFLSGARTHYDGPAETPLRDRLDRLAELLRVPPLTPDERRQPAPPIPPWDRGPASRGKA